MTAVPYTFANQSGNIPLSQLDDNFATLANAVPAYADAAGIATIATTAGSAGIAATVTSNAQANITSVGTLNFLDVAGNVSASFFIGNGSALTGVVGDASTLSGTVLNANIVTSSLTTVGNLISLSVVGNIQANNVSNLQNLTVLDTGYIYNISSTGLASLTTVTADTVSATGNISTANSVVVTGNVQAGNLRTLGIVSSTGNVTGGNINTTGTVSATGNVQAGNLRTTGVVSSTGNITAPWFLGNVSSTSLSATGNITADNFLTGNNVQATNLAVVANVVAGNLNSTGQISAVGNVVASRVLATDVVTNFISSDDSTAVTIEDGVIVNGDVEVTGQATIPNLTVGNINSTGPSVIVNDNLNVIGNASVTQIMSAPNLVTNFISSDDSTAVTIDDDVTLIGDLDVTGGVRVFGRPLQLPSFTADQIANISAVNGDLIYNLTLNKFQGYENGAWANII
jgi:hypothetical protein